MNRVTAESFGGNTKCNKEVLYVFFFANLNAVHQGRIVGLVLTSILILIYIPMTFSELWPSCRRRNVTTKRRHNKTRHNRDAQTEIGISNAQEETRTQVDSALKVLVRSEGRIRLRDLDSKLVGILIFQAALFTYFITCNELYVRRNHTDRSDAQWGFGQVIQMLLYSFET